MFCGEGFFLIIHIFFNLLDILVSNKNNKVIAMF